MNIKRSFLLASLGLMLISGVSFGQLRHSRADFDTSASTKRTVKKSIISFGFFSPVNHHISLGYDQLIGEDMVFSGQLGIIGPGINNSNSYYSFKPRGGFVEAGVKLFFSPDYVYDGMHKFNVMQGGYFKPQVVLSVFNMSYTYYSWAGRTTQNNSTYTGIALLINFGKQWIISHKISLDLYAGIGYSINTNANTNSYDLDGNYYSYITTGPELPLAFAAGMNIGIPY